MFNKLKRINLDIIIVFLFSLHILFFFYFFSRGGYFDYQIPVEAREYASTSSILSFLNSKNPFAVENFPLSINAYSALHPFIISKFLDFFKIQDFEKVILFSRSVSLFVFFAFIIYFFIKFKKKVKLDLILYLTIFFIISISTKISLGTWGNGIGFVLYSLSLLKVLGKNSKKNYFISSVCIILSMHFKFYFILGFLFILMRYYNNIFQRNYISLNFLIIIIAVAIFYLHYHFFPSFYFVSILNQINITEFKDFEIIEFIFSKKFYSEIFFILKNYFYLLIFFSYSIFLSIKQKSLPNKKLLIDTIFLSIFLYLLIFKLWPNMGNHGTYTNNLLIPFIISYIINNPVKYKKIHINLFFLLVLIFPLTTPIFNFNYPGSLNKEEKLTNFSSKKIIGKEFSNSQNVYIDHFIKNLNFDKKIDGSYYFNGNTLHITEASILSYENNLIKKIFNLDDLYSNYKENKAVAFQEISKNYSTIICVFICFNSSLGYDFELFNYKQYKLEEKVKITNIFGQSYNVKVYKNKK